MATHGKKSGHAPEYLILPSWFHTLPTIIRKADSNSEATKDKPASHYIEIKDDDADFYRKFLAAAVEHALEERCAIYQWHAHKRQ